MENKYSNIDHFLHSKLKDFEQTPDAKSYEGVFNHLEHLKASPDFFLNASLSELNVEPDAGAMKHIIERVDHASSIDQLLAQKLEHLHVEPEIAAGINVLKAVEKPIRFRRYFAFAFLLIGLSSTVLFFNTHVDKQSNQTKHPIPNNKVETETVELNKNYKQNDLNPNQVQNDLNENYSKQKSTPNSLNEVSFSSNGNIQDGDQPVFTGRSTPLLEELIESHDDIQRYYNLKKAELFEHQYPTFASQINRFYPCKKRVELSPFSFVINIGWMNNNNSKNEIEGNTHHKDEQTMYNQSMGNNNMGLNIQFGMDYHLYRKANVRIGLQASRIWSSNSINYIHTDVPVYDSTGALKGYLIRPVNASPQINEKVHHQQTQINVPVSMTYQFIKTSKMSLSIGLLAQIGLMNQMKGRFYNFDKESMESMRQGFQSKFQSGMLLQLSSPLSKQLALDFQFQIIRSREKYNIHELNYQRLNIIPKLQFGIRYTPYLIIK